MYFKELFFQPYVIYYENCLFNFIRFRLKTVLVSKMCQALINLNENYFGAESELQLFVWEDGFGRDFR